MACLKLVTWQRQLIPLAPDCLYQDALNDLSAQMTLRKWAQRTNSVIPALTATPEGHRLELPTAVGMGSTPARARHAAALELIRQDPSLGPQALKREAEERHPCDCPRCDP
jgi:hypothetical protein